LESAILVGESLKARRKVYPLYVRSGHYWESIELDFVKKFLAAISGDSLQPLCVLEVPVADLYPGHWSLTGVNVPDAMSVDEAVFLPGRNVLLLSKAMIWCHLQGVGNVALGTLASNPFTDASATFFRAFQTVVNQALQGDVKIHLPYGGLSKVEVILRGRDFPLELTFSCIRPAESRHCGRCNKCAERRRAFADAGMLDRTDYDD
jgi:7-cyano-7-deazaguanine synthase